MLRLATLVLMAANIAAASVTVTPFCKNSARVQIRPPSDNDTRAAQADLRATLDAKGLKELPGALIDACTPGEPVLLPKSADATPVTNGNIRISATADGLAVTAVGTGKTLFTAKTVFSATRHLVPAGFKAIDFSMTAVSANR